MRTHAKTTSIAAGAALFLGLAACSSTITSSSPIAADPLVPSAMSNQISEGDTPTSAAAPVTETVTETATATVTATEAGTETATETVTATESGAETEPAPEPEPDGEVSLDDDDPTFTGVGKPGEWGKYEDGVQVTISEPESYTPSEYAAATDDFTDYLRFVVKLKNDGSDVYDPTMFMLSASSGGVEARRIFDSSNEVGSAPSTKVLPGKSIRFAVAFGVNDPSEVLVELSPGYDYDSVLFQAE